MAGWFRCERSERTDYNGPGWDGVTVPVSRTATGITLGGDEDPPSERGRRGGDPDSDSVSFTVPGGWSRLTGPLPSDVLIAVGTMSLEGWLGVWNTTSVANGTYSLQSVAYDTAGRVSRSQSVILSTTKGLEVGVGQA